VTCCDIEPAVIGMLRFLPTSIVANVVKYSAQYPVAHSSFGRRRRVEQRFNMEHILSPLPG
jgi:hypothetical protein